MQAVVKAYTIKGSKSIGKYDFNYPKYTPEQIYGSDVRPGDDRHAGALGLPPHL